MGLEPEVQPQRREAQGVEDESASENHNIVQGDDSHGLIAVSQESLVVDELKLFGRVANYLLESSGKDGP